MPPVNDDRANAIAILGPGGSVDADNTGATAESPDPLVDVNGNGAETVWYKFAPFADGTLDLWTEPTGEGSALDDTALAVCLRNGAAGKVMFNDSSGESSADDYAEITLAADQADIWVTFDLLLDGNSYSDWVTTNSPNILTLLNASGFTAVDSVFLSGGFWQAGWGVGGGDAPADSRWYLVEFHHVTSGIAELFIDGVRVGFANVLSAIDTRRVRVGLSGGPGPFTNSKIWVDNVKVGTSRGSADLFSDDFESGDFSAWTDVQANTETSVIVFPGGTVLNEVAYNDDAGGIRTTPTYSEVIGLEIAAGLTYYVEVGGFADTLVGTFRLSWSAPSEPPPVTPPPVAPPTQVFGGARFYEAPPWRFIVTDLNTATLTFLDHLALDRSVTVTRAAARVQTLRVPSDSPEVNIPTPDPDSDPFVSEGTRLIYAFRREGRRTVGDVPWRIRAAGLVLEVTDDGDSDHATSTVNAYDPWQYLYRRPVLLADGTYPGEDGRSYPAGTSADEIILEQFTLAISAGTTIFTDFGLSSFYEGTIEACEPLPDDGDGLAITFARGSSLGEMLDTLAATGTCDPVFDPIYDPDNRPGILCEFSLYRQAGSFKPNAVFGWDRWPRSVVDLSRQTSGNERGNRLRMFAGQAGPPVPEEDDPLSVAKFGDYYASQNLVGVPSLAAAHKIAQRQLALRAQGLVTYTLSPAAERAPLLFQEYREADTVPIYASRRFRKQIPGDRVRVESIPIVIGDDQLERVNRMLVSFVPPVNMVLKCDASAAVAYVAYNLPAPQSDIWLTFRVAVTAGQITALAANDYFAKLNTDAGDANSYAEAVGIESPPGIYSAGGFPASAPVSAATWYRCELHYTNGGDAALYVDGTLIASYTEGAFGDIAAVVIGLSSPIYVGADDGAYFDDVKIGTSRGASDLFSDDFSSGVLTGWTTIEGDASVVEDPFS